MFTCVYFFPMAQQPLVGQGLLIIEASRSHSDTPHSIELPGRVISPTQRPAWQHTTLTRNRHPCPPAGFEPVIAASERPQTHAFYRAATGIGRYIKNIPTNWVQNIVFKSTITEHLEGMKIWGYALTINLTKPNQNERKHVSRTSQRNTTHYNSCHMDCRSQQQNDPSSRLNGMTTWEVHRMQRP